MQRIYLPMSTRPEGYCVTHKEQQHYACKFGVSEDFVTNVCMSIAGTMEPQKTATKVKRIINLKLKEAILSASERVS